MLSNVLFQTDRHQKMLSYLAGFLEEKGFSLESVHGMNLPFFFHLMLNVIQHRSLTVSIPVLHVWSKLLASERIGNTDLVIGLIPTLLEICTQRLVRWESLPADSDDPTVVFLVDDIDTVPERHAFVGNYRRYCSAIIETTVHKRPQEAIPHILSTVDANLDGLYNGVEPFNGEGLDLAWWLVLSLLTKLTSKIVFEKLASPHACRYSVCGRRGYIERI